MSDEPVERPDAPESTPTTTAAPRLEVDLFVCVLTDVGNHQRAHPAARRVVEAKLPGVAQAKRPDLTERVYRITVNERVVFGNSVAASIIVIDVDVDAQHLAEERAGILREVHRIAAAATVAHADVQVAIGSEHQMPAVVIRERLINGPPPIGPQ